MSLSLLERGWRHTSRWFFRPAEIFAALSTLAFVGLCSVVFIPSTITKLAVSDYAPPGLQVNFQACSGHTRINCVVDGDTIWLGGEKIRIADIDTPEVFSPECASERVLGDQASGRLLQLLNEGPIEVVTVGQRDVDRYGRKLRVILRDGHSLGEVLIVEGLAHRWGGVQRSWCGA